MSLKPICGYDGNLLKLNSGHHMDKRDGLFLGVLAMACLVGLTGCAATRRNHDTEADVARISRWLPGTYDNSQQVKSDLAQGITPAHDRVELDVAFVDAIAVGRAVFYFQQADADNPMRVFSQRVVSFSLTDKGIVQSVYTVNEPLRWRDGPHEPDIFESMTLRDLKKVSGCEVTWKLDESDKDKKKKLSKEEAARESEHRKFVGTNDSKHCEMTSSAVMGVVNTEFHGEISANQINLAELQFDQDGKPILGGPADPFYRFRRLGK